MDTPEPVMKNNSAKNQSRELYDLDSVHVVITNADTLLGERIALLHLRGNYSHRYKTVTCCVSDLSSPLARECALLGGNLVRLENSNPGIDECKSVFKDGDEIILLPAGKHASLEWQSKVYIDACVELKKSRVIMLLPYFGEMDEGSVSEDSPLKPYNHIAQMLVDARAVIKHYTLFFVTMFDQLFLYLQEDIRSQQKLRLPASPDASLSPITSDDVAQCVSSVTSCELRYRESLYSQKSFVLTGLSPPISLKTLTQHMTRALKVPVEYETVSQEETPKWIEHLIQTHHLSVYLEEDLRILQGFCSLMDAGKLNFVTNAVHDITGAIPESLIQFFTEHRPAFGGRYRKNSVVIEDRRWTKEE